MVCPDGPDGRSRSVLPHPADALGLPGGAAADGDPEAGDVLDQALVLEPAEDRGDAVAGQAGLMPQRGHADSLAPGAELVQRGHYLALLAIVLLAAAALLLRPGVVAAILPLLAAGAALDLPRPPGELVVQLALVDVHGPQPALAARAAGAEPDLVSLAGRERLTAGQQQPLPRKLGDAGEGEVRQLQRLVIARRRLGGVVAEGRGRPGLQAG